MHSGALPTALAIAAATTLGIASTDAGATAPSAPPSGPLVIRVDGGFRWGDAAIGAVTGFGAALVVTGGIALRRSTRPSTPSETNEQGDKR